MDEQQKKPASSTASAELFAALLSRSSPSCRLVAQLVGSVNFFVFSCVREGMYKLEGTAMAVEVLYLIAALARPYITGV